MAEAGSHSVRGLVRDLRTDPVHLPERLAEFAVHELSGRADAAVAALRDQDVSPDDQRKTLATSGVRRTIAEGAVVGGPFLVFIPLAFCAALLSQIRMVLELGAVSGFPAADAARAVDLLVLQGAFGTTREAEKAMAEPRGAAAGKKRSQWFGMVMRMALLLGITSKGVKTGRIRQVLSLVSLTLLFVIGFVVPLIWIPAMAVSYRKATTMLARRAVVYFESLEGGQGIPDLQDGAALAAALQIRVRPVETFAVIRTLSVALLPVVAALVLLVTNTRVLGDRWVTSVAALVVLTALGYVGWFLLARRRRRRRAAEIDEATR